MKNEFVPYDIALAMKELGFDEPCLAGYYITDGNGNPKNGEFKVDSFSEQYSNTASAPLYQQAFRWFREKYGIHASNDIDFGGDIYSFHLLSKNFKPKQRKNGKLTITEDTYEEAELACLRKLIEIVKEK